jgi:hypothetical protein
MHQIHMLETHSSSLPACKQVENHFNRANSWRGDRGDSDPGQKKLNTWLVCIVLGVILLISRREKLHWFFGALNSLGKTSESSATTWIRGDPPTGRDEGIMPRKMHQKPLMACVWFSWNMGFAL